MLEKRCKEAQQKLTELRKDYSKQIETYRAFEFAKTRRDLSIIQKKKHDQLNRQKSLIRPKMSTLNKQ